ncbi:MAG TPA: hypothetical protein VGJ27_08915 [Gaiellaceae bacterium]
MPRGNAGFLTPRGKARGHANPIITLEIYAHLVDATAHNEKVAPALQAATGGKPTENGGGEWRRTNSGGAAPELAIHPATAVAGD